MSNMKIAAQLYTVREFTKTPSDIEESFKRIKSIGYDAIQVSAIGPIEHQHLKDIADSAKLTICATHIGFDRLKNDLDDVIKQHKIWECKYVGLGAMPAEYRKSFEGYVEFSKVASEYAKMLAESGLRFIYHNHNFEFVKFNGKTGMDILLEKTDPETFDFEIDTYWIQAGGANPVDWIKKVQGRMKVVHFKDMGAEIDFKPVMAEVGEGNMNWKAIIDACHDIGVEWCAVEQDICKRDPFDSLAISLKNLKEFGL